MKIVIAPDSFKGSMSAKEVCDNIEIGIKKAVSNPEIVKIPMADGGEGTVQSLVDATNGKMINAVVKDPLFRNINAEYGILGNNKTAVIEMAAASGLALLSSEEQNPMNTTTFGTGQLIFDALNRGCRDFIIGIGGSATNDGGIGLASALGVRFLNKSNNDVNLYGEGLTDIEYIDTDNLDPRIKECRIHVACDVTNVLCGENGAAYVYASQKGASYEEIEKLDRGLENLSCKILKYLSKDVKNIKGSGAAGGTGAGLIAFLDGKLEPGINIVIKYAGLERKICDSDLVITGEGRIDCQTLYGKTILGVAQTAKKQNIPVIAICGSMGEGIDNLYDFGLNGIFSIVNSPMNLEECIKKTPQLLQSVTENIFRICKL